MAGTSSFDNLGLASCGIGGVREIHGGLDAAGLRIAIVASRFNTDLTQQLAGDAVSTLLANGAAAGDIDVIWVTGAFEIPSVLEPLAAGGQYDALVGLGAVIQGETIHANSIAAAVAQSLCELARRHGLPVIDGVVVAPDRKTAEVRCASGPRSRGAYAACAAVEMADVFRKLPPSGSVP